MQKKVIVIGAGPGGYVAAMKCAMNGCETILVEKDEIGGTCLNRGCIPTKALLHCADEMDAISDSEKLGIYVKYVDVNFHQVNKYKDDVVRKLTDGVQYLLKKRGVKNVTGTAVFTGAKEITVTDYDDHSQVLSADVFIIATGSESTLPRIPGVADEGVLTATEALDFSCPPDNMIIIGGGVIGMEIGSLYARFGKKITVLEYMPEILTGTDMDLVKLCRKKADSMMKIITGAKVTGIEDVGFTAEDQVALKKVFYEKDGQALSVTAQKVLVCTGRTPNTRRIGLEIAGVKVNERGFIEANDRCETTAPDIYAIGDVNGKVLLAHAASAQAVMVANLICGHEDTKNIKLVPSCIYTKPEMASVGKSEQQLKQEGVEYTVGKFPLAANGRALSMGETEGFIKILAGKQTKEILGAHIVGVHATDMIGELTLAIQAECTLQELVDTIHPHPTVSEIIPEAAEAALFGAALHV